MSEGGKGAEGRRFDSAMALVSAISSDGKSVHPFDDFKKCSKTYDAIVFT